MCINCWYNTTKQTELYKIKFKNKRSCSKRFYETKCSNLKNSSVFHLILWKYHQKNWFLLWLMTVKKIIIQPKCMVVCVYLGDYCVLFFLLNIEIIWIYINSSIHIFMCSVLLSWRIFSGNLFRKLLKLTLKWN